MLIPTAAFRHQDQGWGIQGMFSSYVHAPWLCSPSSKEAEAAAAHQQDKALPTLQGHPGSCISASAALNVQTA